MRTAILLNEEELNHELTLMTDAHTDELFARHANEEDSVISFPVSRLIVDPERFLEDTEEKMSEVGMGVIYTRTSSGKLLRHPPSESERARLIDAYYNPHHNRLNEATRDELATYGRALILDCHSFPSKPLPYELNQDPNRPDICLGTDSFHTPKNLIELAETFFREHNLRTAQNKPFEGTYVPLKFLEKDKRVFSLMLEINRKLYMDEATGEKSETFDDIKNLIADMVQHIVANIFQA